MTQKKKKQLSRQQFTDKDVGSAEVQVGLLTDKITKAFRAF